MDLELRMNLDELAFECSDGRLRDGSELARILQELAAGWNGRRVGVGHYCLLRDRDHNLLGVAKIVEGED